MRGRRRCRSAVVVRHVHRRTSRPPGGANHGAARRHRPAVVGPAFIPAERVAPGRTLELDQEQIEAFEGSPEQRDLQREIDRVRTAFVAANPGFDLYVNSQVRSLDLQIEHWNSNESVKAAADEILVAAQALIASPGFPADHPEQARQALETFLAGHRPVPTPTIAAPGLSLHGQMRAIDFQVHQGGRVIAGPSTAAIATDWTAAGWAARLDAAVREASNRFVGPQASPPAPWHYTYLPEGAGAGDAFE